MIKLAVGRAIGVAHGYIHVDATGISVTRRDDYREKAFMPLRVYKRMLMFDNPDTRSRVKPFSFWLTFHPTTKVVKRDKRAVNAARRIRVAAARARGEKPKVYSLAKRIAGVAIGALD
jgi:hypothetical protein